MGCANEKRSHIVTKFNAYFQGAQRAQGSQGTSVTKSQNGIEKKMENGEYKTLYCSNENRYIHTCTQNTTLALSYFTVSTMATTTTTTTTPLKQVTK